MADEIQTETSEKIEGEETLPEQGGEQGTELTKEEYDKKLADLEEQKEKRKMRYQRNQKKFQEGSKETQPVDKDFIRSVVKEEQKDIEAKTLLVTKYPDATESMQTIEKLKAEKWLSWEEAYKLAKFDDLNDPAYQARQRQWRTAIYGSVERHSVWEDDQLKSMLWADPRLAKKSKE